MTPDQALRCIEQERLDVLAEGQTEADCNMIAAYVLASAYRKLLMRLDGPSGTSVGPWKECVYKHPDAPVPSIRVDPAYLLKLEAAAERYRWLRERPSFIGWDWWEPRVPGDVLITPEFMDAAIDERLRQLATGVRT